MGWLGWGGAAGCVALAVASGLAERRRSRRRDLDRVGWVAWPALQLAAIIGALLCASVALNA